MALDHSDGLTKITKLLYKNFITMHVSGMNS